MKKLSVSVLAAVVCLLLLGLTAAVRAEDSDTVTITGMGKCAKCALHQSDKCQNVVEVEKDGKKEIYWLEGAKSKAFHHDNLCQDSKKVTVTGTVKEKDGKKVMKVSEIKAAD